MPSITALVPAHNEADGITATLLGLTGQTHRLDRVLVVADNCTDDTVALAEAGGAEVLVTVGNTARKAGALNQGLAHLLPSLADDDLILIMDADSVLTPAWVALALPHIADARALSGAYVAADKPGLLPLVQRVEYAQERRKIARKGGRVNVLSGAACLFTAGLLRQVAAARGTLIPGRPGDVYDEASLTEDYELTLAVQSLGVTPRSPRELRVVTDVLSTLPELYGQRLRWQRGYLETLVRYPLRLTWFAWLRQANVYAATALPFAVAALTLTAWHVFGLHIEWRWLLIQPVFIAAEVVGARTVGRRGMLLAGLMLPLMAYNVWRGAVYWRALTHALRGRSAAWT